MIPLRITAELAGPMADYPPALDSLLVEIAAHRLRRPAPRQARPECRNRPMRCNPAPSPWDSPEIPLARRELGGWPIHLVSSPITPSCPADASHFGKRIDVSRARMLRPDQRRVVVTTNTWTKSYYLPVRVLTVPRVIWFAVGDAAGLRDLLSDVSHLGRKTAHGWGRVRQWRVEEVEADHSWFATDEEGRPVLMRVLPLCPELPAGMDGWRLDYGACCPPYWHRDRYTEVVTPC